MLAKYATIVRRAGALTAVAAAIMVAVSAALVGVKGLTGALIGVALVAVFFGISILAVGRAARVSPPAMMVTALASYLVKVVALAVILSRLNGTTAFSTKTLAFVAVGCILVWTGSQAAFAMKTRMLYVEPGPSRAEPSKTHPAQAEAVEPEPEPHAARRGD